LTISASLLHEQSK